MPQKTNLVVRKNVSNDLLVPLDRLPRPFPQSRAKETKIATSRQNLSRNDTLNSGHFQTLQKQIFKNLMCFS